MRLHLRILATGVAALLLGTPVTPAQAAFSDQTAAAGLGHASAVELDMDGRHMFSGGAIGDFDQDGWPDLFLLGGGGLVADALYINNGDGTFTDEAAAWGVDAYHRGRGATVGDFNADGWPDLYVTSSGDMSFIDRPGQHRLYRNNGDGTFTDIALAAGVHETSGSDTVATGAAFGDYDLDGDLDLFVCGWQSIDGNHLFRNDGNETFTNVTVAAGISYGFDGFSPRFVDMNGDRWPELIVAADFVTSRYYVNDQDGTFTNDTAASGTGLEDNGMGSAVADFNGDGLPDWYVTSIYRDLSTQDGNYMYVNQGDGTYSVLPEPSGARNGGWGWGVEAFDFDHDGDVDIAETNGWIEPEFVGETSYLWRNNGDMTFTEVQASAGFTHSDQGRSLMTFDYDRDGDMDVVITTFDGPVMLYRNDLSGADTHWLEISLDTSGDPSLAPSGYGSRVIVTAGGTTQYRWVDGGATYLGRSQLVAHFGLGAATTVDTLTVEWANGTDTVLTNVAADQIVTVSASPGSGGPGEASRMSVPAEHLRAAWNGGTGEVDVTYTPSCDATDHTIYFGPLSAVSTYGYSGAACAAGVSGTASFDPGAGSSFFLVVGENGSVEGSYGRNSASVERPEDSGTLACDRPQDLAGTCGT